MEHEHSHLCAQPQRIVVGVDRTDHSRAAFHWAACEARLRRTHLHIVHAWEPPEMHEEATAAQARIDMVHRHEARALVKELFAGTSLRVPAGMEWLSPQAHTAEALIAASHDAALLVVGSHAGGALAGIFASVAQRTAAFAACPVVVVHAGHQVPGAPDCGQFRKFNRIVVGVDDSFTARNALRWAAGEALRRNAALQVIHSAVPLPSSRPGKSAHAAYRMLAYLLEETLVGPLAKVQLDPLFPHPEFPEDAAGTLSSEELLIESAEQADLLVIGTHGHGAFSGALFGSVSSDSVHHAACPVALLPDVRQDQEKRVRHTTVELEVEHTLRSHDHLV